MITFEEARQMALNELQRVRPHDNDLVVLFIGENDEEWIFDYNSGAFLQNGDLLAKIIGRTPIRVTKQEGEVRWKRG